jgi:hypothetical protein
MKMQTPPSEANSGAGDLSGERRLGECPKGRISGRSINAKPDRMDGARRSQNCELMDKSRIAGRHGASRGHKQATNKSAVASFCTSGMPVEVNSAAVRWGNVQLPGEWKRSGHGRPDSLPNSAFKSHGHQPLRSQQRS